MRGYNMNNLGENVIVALLVKEKLKKHIMARLNS